MMTLFSIRDLTKIYGKDSSAVTALNKISLEIPAHKFVVILGESGSGKSTLLNMIGCMDKPTSGEIICQGTPITNLNKAEMTEFRKEKIGFVFQSYNLLPDLNAVENVEFSTEVVGLSQDYAQQAVAAVGLADRGAHFPAQLSGGEQQRISIARALAKQPEILLCDEPTGALDFETGIHILEVLKAIQSENHSSILLITHSKEIAKIADVVIRMRSGQIIEYTENPRPLLPTEVEW
ncbi:ABC transporter ATP-binding protein [Enterococcus florum]|uniref:ABC transporter ATP-binding protein n=1 Tax=Enterococcus florum TaxID=2480627 RepID=A0A4P5PSB8_9ENTE|nr:ABC transporter ATP-binding protein [Enterococcus florum]GCF95543.1 ABC transporter ATP-binding protein [Enterococcus florum]